MAICVKYLFRGTSHVSTHLGVHCLHVSRESTGKEGGTVNCWGRLGMGMRGVHKTWGTWGLPCQEEPLAGVHGCAGIVVPRQKSEKDSWTPLHLEAPIGKRRQKLSVTISHPPTSNNYKYPPQPVKFWAFATAPSSGYTQVPLVLDGLCGDRDAQWGGVSTLTQPPTAYTPKSP